MPVSCATFVVSVGDQVEMGERTMRVEGREASPEQASKLTGG